MKAHATLESRVRKAGAIALLFGIVIPSVVAAKPRPDAERLVILPIIISEQDSAVSISSIFSAVAEVASGRPSLRVISNEEMFVVEPDLNERVQECGPDEKCLADRLRGFDLRLGLVVVVNQVLDPPLIALRLVNTEQRRLIGAAVSPLAPEEADISAAIQARARKLFDEAGHAAASRIVVEVTPKDAQILVGEGVEPEAGVNNLFVVAAGTYAVHASREGFDSAQANIDAISGEEHRVALELSEQVAIYESVWFWAVVGAVVVAGTTTAIWAASRPPACLCVAAEGVDCPEC